MDLLHRDSLAEGGFAGLREHRLVMDPKVWGVVGSGAWPGIGNLVYLADARFQPRGETGLHPHHEIDVISIVLAGRIAHAGSLGHGQELTRFQVQVQRAGAAGFSHNEVNPDATENRMLQMWVLPEQPGSGAEYRVYQPSQGRLTRIYGGSTDQQQTLAADTLVDVALLGGQETARIDGPFLAYLAVGQGVLNGTAVRTGDLIRDETLQFESSRESLLVIAHLR